jgi:hypothetical protein
MPVLIATRQAPRIRRANTKGIRHLRVPRVVGKNRRSGREARTRVSATPAPLGAAVECFSEAAQPVPVSESAVSAAINDTRFITAKIRHRKADGHARDMRECPLSPDRRNAKARKPLAQSTGLDPHTLSNRRRPVNHQRRPDLDDLRTSNGHAPSGPRYADLPPMPYRRSGDIPAHWPKSGSHYS